MPKNESQERTAPRVSVLGLGRMGTPIAAALLAAGAATTVWNRTAATADALAARGAVRAETAAEAVAAAPLVVVTLLDPGTVRRTLEPAAAALRGRTLVNLTSSTPDEARELAAWAEGLGADYLDGAMMALPETVATPEGFFLYSGSEAAFTAHRHHLEVMAPAHFLGADPGAAEIHDLALLGTGYAALTGFLHATALLDAAGHRAGGVRPAGRPVAPRHGRLPARTGPRGRVGGLRGRGLLGRPQPGGRRQPAARQRGPRPRHGRARAAEGAARRALGRRARAGQLLQRVRTAAGAADSARVTVRPARG